MVLDKFDGMSGETATSHLKSELRNLMSAQDAFFMNFARYGAVEEVGDHWRYNPTIELQVLFLRADSTAFDVAATTQWTRSLTCGVWVGEPSQQTGRPEAPEREVHCWDTPNEDRNEYRTVGAARLGAR